MPRLRVVFAGMIEAVDHRQAVARARRSGRSPSVCRARRLRGCCDIRRYVSRPASPPPWRHSRTAPCPTCRRPHGANRDRCAAARTARAWPGPAPRCAIRSPLRLRIRFWLREGTKSVDRDSHRDAGIAAVAGRAIGDHLAATEAGMGQRLVQRLRQRARQAGEDLALHPARQIRAGPAGRQEELGKAGGCAVRSNRRARADGLGPGRSMTRPAPPAP